MDSLRRGDIGEVRMISLWWLYPRPPFVGKEWFRDAREGGFYLDAGSHCFDFLRWIAGAEPSRLFAQLATYNQDSETPRSTASRAVRLSIFKRCAQASSTASPSPTVSSRQGRAIARW